VTLPTTENLASFSVFVARRYGVELVRDQLALGSALRNAEVLVTKGDLEEVALFYGIAKDAVRIGPVAIFLAFALIVQATQSRGKCFKCDRTEMGFAFGAVANGSMAIDQLRQWLGDRTS